MEVSDSMANISLGNSSILVCISALIIMGLGIWYRYSTYKKEKKHIDTPSKLNKNYVSEFIKNLEKQKRGLKHI